MAQPNQYLQQKLTRDRHSPSNIFCTRVWSVRCGRGARASAIAFRPAKNLAIRVAQPIDCSTDAQGLRHDPRAAGGKHQRAIAPKLTPDEARIIVSIPKQRAWLILGEQVVIDSPISSGKRGHSSPTGNFTVLEKDKSHHSSIYGDYKDAQGRTVRGGVSARIDSAPSGTHFVGASMKWFMRLTGEGVGMHVGICRVIPRRTVAFACPRKRPNFFIRT